MHTYMMMSVLVMKLKRNERSKKIVVCIKNTYQNEYHRTYIYF